MADDLLQKTVEQAQADSIQSRATQAGEDGGGFLILLAHAGEYIPAWWSRQRDVELGKIWRQSDHVSGAFYTLASKLSSVPRRVEPRDPSIARHRKLAEEYQERIDSEAEYGQGWDTCIVKFLLDLWTQDNGAFLEIIGGGNKGGPLRGLPVGLANLDSARCSRTGEVEYPVVYQDTDGTKYRLHRSRVLFRSQLPSTLADMHDVGFCWLSRCINAAQSMVDDLVFKQEKLGSRPTRAIGITKGGLSPKAVESALRMAQSTYDSRGLRRYSQIPIMGNSNLPDADLSLIDLNSVPDGFSYETDLTLGMYTIALTGAVPIRWLWPATVTGATKADAMYQHVAGLTGGPGATLNMIATMLGGPLHGGSVATDTTRFLPRELRLVFDFQDDEQDRTEAEICRVRSETRGSDLTGGVISIRVAREQMLADGELTDDQFNELELDDGRLPDGMDVLTLFYSRDDQMVGLLAIDAIGEPLDIETNDPFEWVDGIDRQIRLAEDISVNGVNANLRRKARQAVVAMQKLRDLYLSPGENAETEPMDDESPNVVDEDDQEPEPEEGPPAEETGEEVEEDANPFDITKAGPEQYKASLRAAVRGYWSGQLQKFQFVDAMSSAIRRRLTQAWNEGAAECGIMPDDMTRNQRQVLTRLINTQISFVGNYERDIRLNSKARFGFLNPLLDRVDMWVNRYYQALDLAKVVLCGEERLMWEIDPTKESCRDCLKLNGKVYTASTWNRIGIHPKSDRLACGGFKCGCGLHKTDAPISRGVPPTKFGKEA